MPATEIGNSGGLLTAQALPEHSVDRDADEANGWHDETGGHAVEVADVAHQLGHERAAHDGHDDE